MLQDRDPTTFAIIEAARLARGKGMAACLGMMAQRLFEMQRVLKPTGSIYLHCDDTAGACLKMFMDSVFGRSQFQAQITWWRTFAHNDKVFGAVSDYLLWYSLADDPVRNIESVTVPFTADELEEKYPHHDERGRHLRDNLMGPGTTDGESGRAWKDCDPTQYGRCWSTPKTGKYAKCLNDFPLPGYLEIAGVHDR